MNKDYGKLAITKSLYTFLINVYIQVNNSKCFHF